MVKSGRAADHGAGFDVTVRAALGGNNHVVANLAVTGHADLPGENHVLADFGGTGQAHLRAQQGVFSDLAVVAYLDEMANLVPPPRPILPLAAASDPPLSLNSPAASIT